VQAKAVDDLSVERAPRALLQVVHDLAALGEAGDQWRRVTGVAVPSNESIKPTSAATPANASTTKAMPADILATQIGTQTIKSPHLPAENRPLDGSLRVPVEQPRRA
jgi:hypothetical protein